MMLILRALWAVASGTVGPLLRKIPWWAWLAAAFLAWGAWQRHTATVATKRAAAAETQAAVQAAGAKAEREQRQIEQTYTDNARSAANAYASNLRTARADADRARAVHDRLRDAIASAPGGGCAGAPSAAASGSDGAAQLRAVLGSCAASLRELAAVADDDAAKLKALQAHMRAIGVAPAPSAPAD